MNFRFLPRVPRIGILFSRDVIEQIRGRLVSSRRRLDEQDSASIFFPFFFTRVADTPREIHQYLIESVCKPPLNIAKSRRNRYNSVPEIFLSGKGIARGREREGTIRGPLSSIQISRKNLLVEIRCYHVYYGNVGYNGNREYDIRQRHVIRI